MVCANTINAISFTLCNLKREVERQNLALGPWADWYSVYLSLLHAQRCVPSFLSDVLVGVKDKALVAGVEYLEVVHKGCTYYIVGNLSLTTGNSLCGVGIVYVSAKALSKVVELAPGGSMKVTGELCCKDCVIDECIDNSLLKALKNGSLTIAEAIEILENREKKEEHCEEEEECEPFESSEPFETVDFTTTTDVDGQNIQEVEKRLRQILDVTETNTEVTEQ